MKRLLLIILTLLLILAGGVTWFLAQLFWFSPDIVVSKQTTWLTEPLADDGLPDYAAYLLERGREGVTPENNGAIPFLQAMWPAGLKPFDREPLCIHLEMEVPAEEGMKSPLEDEELQATLSAWLTDLDAGVNVAADEMSGDERVKQLLEHFTTNPWRREDCPPLADWIDAQAGDFDLLHEAARRPKFHLPSPHLITHPNDPVINGDSPAIAGSRVARVALTLRGFLRLGEGDIAAAWRDAEVVYRLGTQLRGDDLIIHLAAIHAEEMANALTLAILDSPVLTLDVARQVLAVQKDRHLRSNMVEAIDVFERLSFVTALLALAEKRKVTSMTRQEFLEEWCLEPLDGYEVDWNVVLEEGHQWYDRLVKTGKIEDLRMRNEELERFDHEVANIDSKKGVLAIQTDLRPKARSRALGELFIGLYLPVVPATLQSEERCNAYTQLVQIAAGLAVYRLREGEYPETLEKLLPEILDQLRADLYAAPFRYQRTERGYLLYSTGLNGVDEQGSHRVYRRYAGYDVFEEYDVYVRDSAVRKELGIPPRDEGDADPVNLHLKDQIPPGADDWSLRLPLPKPQLPLPGDPSAQGTGERDEV